MKEEIVIRKASVRYWKEFKEIRLEAVKNNPEGFGSAYEEEVDRSKERWKISLINKNKIVFLALDGKIPIAISIISYESSIKMNHLAHIYSVYVKPEYRGRKISSRLIEFILADASNKKKIKKVKLSVVTTQTPAINLYKKFGFKIIAKLKKEVRVGKKYYDEYIMEKNL